MYKMIRCGSGSDLVIMVSPADAGMDTHGATFYRCASWRIEQQQVGVFNPISKNLALSYFDGIADGIGFEIPPDEKFPSLEAAQEFVRAARRENNRKRLEEDGLMKAKK